MIILGASYDSVSDAEVDYEAVKAAYSNAGVGHGFDAAVLERGADGKVNRRQARGLDAPRCVDRSLDRSSGRDAARHRPGRRRSGWSGCRSNHRAHQGRHDDKELKQLGEVLEKGQAGLIVNYATNMADQVAASIKAENKYVSDAVNADADELVKQMKAADK